ncbi:MAG: 6-pyruvoyl trahydropterin synthase family protein [Rhodoferax sp.]
MKPISIHVASAPFQAARQIDQATPETVWQGLHGHGFWASAHADLGAQGLSCAGAELDALGAAFLPGVRALDYQHLNALLASPTDAGIAQWLGARCGPVAAHSVLVQSTHDQGTLWQADGPGQIWRRYHFQAAHQLPHVPAGHKCGNLHGHSFGVVLHSRPLPLQAEDPMGYARLDQAWAQVFPLLDHTYLNAVPGLENPTSELLSRWLWQRLCGLLPSLCGVSVFETASCGAHYDGQRFQIWKEFTLDSAVVQTRAPAQSARQRLHGYTYLLRLHLCAELDQVMGWALDFGDVKTVFSPTFLQLDHKPLHQLTGLDDCSVGALARWIWATVQPQLPQLCTVELFETPGCGAIHGLSGHRLVLPLRC